MNNYKYWYITKFKDIASTISMPSLRKRVAAPRFLPVPIEKFEPVNNKRIELIAKKHMEGLNPEETKKLATVTEKVKKIAPAVTAKDYLAIALLLQTVEESKKRHNVARAMLRREYINNKKKQIKNLFYSIKISSKKLKKKTKNIKIVKVKIKNVDWGNVYKKLIYVLVLICVIYLLNVLDYAFRAKVLTKAQIENSIRKDMVLDMQKELQEAIVPHAATIYELRNKVTELEGRAIPVYIPQKRTVIINGNDVRGRR